MSQIDPLNNLKNYKTLSQIVELELDVYKDIIAEFFPGFDEDDYKTLARKLYIILSDITLNPEEDVEKENNVTVDNVISSLSTLNYKLSIDDAKKLLKKAKNVRRYLDRYVNGSFDSIESRKEYLKGIADGVIQGPMTNKPSVDQPWLKHYDIDRVNVKVPEVSIFEYMESRCTDYNLTAIEYFGKKISYKEMFKKIDQVARAFHSMGIEKGDSVALLLPNTPESVYSLYALNKIGAIANIVDLRKKKDQLVHAVNETNPKVIIATDIFASSLEDEDVKGKLCTDSIFFASIVDSAPALIKQIVKKTGHGLPKEIDYKKEKEIVSKYKSFDDLIKIGKHSAVEIEPCSKKNDVVAIVHTSGTTGESKSVQITNYNYNAMVCEYEDVIVKSRPGEKILTQVPPFLAYTTIMATHLPLCLNVTLVMIPEYEPDKTSDRVFKYKINHIVGAPGDYYSFLENPETSKRDYGYVKTLGSGSDTLDVEIRKAVDALLAVSGCNVNVFEGYGMTEVGSAAVTNLPYYIVDGSVGIPLPKMKVKIINPDNMEECSYLEQGEICISGDTLTKGYYDNEEANEELMFVDENGDKYVRTGDLGFVNQDGNVFYRGRIKRMFPIFEGIKINPMDIEKVINGDDRIETSLVVPIPNTERGRGSWPIANIIIKPEYIDQQEQIIEDIFKACEEQLGHNYQPKQVVVRESFPLTPVGKLDFRKLSSICDEEINGRSKGRER